MVASWLRQRGLTAQDALLLTSVAHLYVSEHHFLRWPKLKHVMRDCIRVNRLCALAWLCVRKYTKGFTSVRISTCLIMNPQEMSWRHVNLSQLCALNGNMVTQVDLI